MQCKQNKWSHGVRTGFMNRRNHLSDAVRAEQVVAWRAYRVLHDAHVYAAVQGRMNVARPQEEAPLQAPHRAHPTAKRYNSTPYRQTL